MCNANVGMVNAVAKAHPGKFEVATRRAQDHASELKAHEISSHGVVCMLGDKTLWKKTDHDMSQAEFDAGVKVVLDGLK